MTRIMHRRVCAIVVIIFTLTHWTITFAADNKYNIGVRGDIVLADGKPANDIMGLGIYGKYSLTKEWTLGLAVDISAYDYERPWKVVGVVQDSSVKTIDASTSSTMFSTWVERHYDTDFIGSSVFFWSAGLGLNITDVNTVSGPVEGGGTFNIETNVDNEIVLMAGAGLNWDLNDAWVVESTLGAEYHKGDWNTVDTESGKEGKITNYNTWSLRIGILRHF